MSTDATGTPAQPRVPVWLEIRRYIQDLIAGPGYAPGDRIPSERALAEQLAANRMTVRKAVDSLVAMGLLERNGTSGTRITAPRVARPVDAHTSQGIARIVRAGGGTPGNKLLHFEQARATGKIAERLHVPEGAELVVFRRLWTVNDTPFCIETSHLPADRVPGLAAEDLMAGQSLYGLLHDRYGITTTGGERLIGIGFCNDMEARLLHLKPGAAILLLRLLVSDEAGRPIEYMTSVNHPQLVVFRTTKAGAI
ncbi:GntR family transcriptional regulator [Limobrevibacterium gyesilva]|uniref:GntR family transcriptional regulator n=1 Tax=Limobrevibacterium gyesilva TaxID=2991712 RepID=A0AA41YK76_9PROT|nr:GntR family transcriptional regulator [Limobrevibacterium gyesilva]MCW3475319.1 GntR family transcriptional regulator [Limobrevibacterium gyesilva]